MGPQSYVMVEGRQSKAHPFVSGEGTSSEPCFRSCRVLFPTDRIIFEPKVEVSILTKLSSGFYCSEKIIESSFSGRIDPRMDSDKHHGFLCEGKYGTLNSYPCFCGSFFLTRM